MLHGCYVPMQLFISVLIDMFVVILFQSGFQEDGDGHMNLDIYKHATAFLLQTKETHRLTQVIYAINFPLNVFHC